MLVVWESVLWTDLAPPLSGMLELVDDARVRQFWDPGRLLSAQMVEAILAHPERFPGAEIDESTIVWDVVAIFPAGSLWGDEVPVPEYQGYPVVYAAEEFARALEARTAPPS